MQELIALPILFVVSILVSLYSSMVGGGGLIMIPLLLFLGLPVKVAIGSNKLGVMGVRVGALIQYWKHGKIRWKFVIPFTVIFIIGSVIGALIFIEVNEVLMEKLVGIFLIALVPLMLIKRNAGVKRTEVSKKKRILGYCLMGIVALYSGFFGVASGTMVYTVLIFTMGFTLIEASATHKIPGIITTSIVLFILGFNGLLNYKYALVQMAGMFIGGTIGARHAVKKGNKFVKGVFITLAVVSAVKLLFF